MKILADVHCHTNVSDHAHSTVYEMVLGAKQKNLELISITNHGMAMSDSPHEWHFSSLKRNVPYIVEGIKLLKGAEVNMTDYEGGLDIPEFILKQLDIVIVSMHDVCIPPADVESHTKGWLRAIENPYVDILGHSGSPQFEYELDTVLCAAKENNKWIEINNHTFEARAKSAENCYRIAKRCKELGVKMVVGSDAHFMTQVGEFGYAVKMLKELAVPEELIVNLNAARLIGELGKRRPKLKELFGNEGDK